jgi:hypothetical protein
MAAGALDWLARPAAVADCGQYSRSSGVSRSRPLGCPNGRSEEGAEVSAPWRPNQRTTCPIGRNICGGLLSRQKSWRPMRFVLRVWRLHPFHSVASKLTMASSIGLVSPDRSMDETSAPQLPHQFRTRNDGIEVHQTLPNIGKSPGKSTTVCFALPLITVWLQVRVLPGPPAISKLCGHFENDLISALRTTRFRFENDSISDLPETPVKFLLDFFRRICDPKKVRGVFSRRGLSAASPRKMGAAD